MSEALAEIGRGIAAAYDPDLGPVEVAPFSAKDRKRWAKAENWGAWLAYPEDGSDHYHEVWMLNSGGRVRFGARGGLQYGPEHGSVVIATYWAFAHGWRDPSMTAEYNVRCIMEVRRGGAMLHDEPLGAGGITTSAHGLPDPDHNKGQPPSPPAGPRLLGATGSGRNSETGEKEVTPNE